MGKGGTDSVERGTRSGPKKKRGDRQKGAIGNWVVETGGWKTYGNGESQEGTVVTQRRRRKPLKIEKK